MTWKSKSKYQLIYVKNKAVQIQIKLWYFENRLDCHSKMVKKYKIDAEMI